MTVNMDFLVGHEVTVFQTERVTAAQATAGKPEGTTQNATYKGTCVGYSVEDRGEGMRPSYWLVVAIEAGKLMTVRMETCNVELYRAPCRVVDPAG